MYLRSSCDDNCCVFLVVDRREEEVWRGISMSEESESSLFVDFVAIDFVVAADGGMPRRRRNAGGHDVPPDDAPPPLQPLPPLLPDDDDIAGMESTDGCDRL